MRACLGVDGYQRQSRADQTPIGSAVIGSALATMPQLGISWASVGHRLDIDWALEALAVAPNPCL
ncbi:MAG: hypothetical protein VW738_11060, partial [Pseudomonadales bacterium]